MNNPGIDVAIWEQLRAKWAQLDASEQTLKVDFKLINVDVDKDKTLAIDVIQSINEEVFVETVQRTAGEAYETLGIVGLSMEELVEAYKKMLHQLYRRVKKQDADLVVVMTPHSATSGETTGYLQQPETELKSSVLLNYQHYYLLNALHEKMIELSGDRWSRVKAVYHSGEVEILFEHEANGATG